MAASESTSTTWQHPTSEQQASHSLCSRLPPIKPLESAAASAGLPSLMQMSAMRSYKMPSSMKLPYDSSTKIMKYPLSEKSLASLLASRRAHMQRMRQLLATEMPFALSRQVSFGTQEHSAMDRSNSSTESLQVHHEPPSLVEEPAPKRRRFQRRNSKTPAMLMSSMQHAADIVAADDRGDESQEEQSDKHRYLDGGLEIAQNLVRQLQLRRQKSKESSKVLDASS